MLGLIKVVLYLVSFPVRRPFHKGATDCSRLSRSEIDLN